MAGAQRYPERSLDLEEPVASRAPQAEHFDGAVAHFDVAVAHFDGAVAHVSHRHSEGEVDECQEVEEVPRLDRAHPSDHNRPNRAQYTHACICQERQASAEAKQVKISIILCVNDWLK